MLSRSRVRRGRISPARVRRTVQLAFGLFCIFCGWRFFLYYQWATGASAVYVPKPPMVEGFLPISALLGAVHFFNTGMWDPVHPAGLTIFFAALAICLLLRKGFCGYICPAGWASNLLERTGKRLGLNRSRPAPARTAVHKAIRTVLHAPKYILMAGFLWTMSTGMDARAVESFLTGPYNMVADSKMLLFFLHPSATALTVLAVLALLSLFVSNPWCRFLCPYGALLGIAALFSPCAVRRNAAACTGCGRCSAACPAGIAVHAQQRVNRAECMGCTECVSSCPQKDCLQLTCLNKPQYDWAIAYGTVALLWTAYLAAVWWGKWDVSIDAALIQKLHSTMM